MSAESRESVAQGLAPAEAARWVLEQAKSLGFVVAGLARAQPSEQSAALQDWLSEGQHGEMAYLAEHAKLRGDVGRLQEGTVSAVVVADAYPAPPDAPTEAAADQELGSRPAQGRLARYGRGRDYHKVLKKRLHKLADAMRERYPGHEHRVCVDTAPLLEREQAARAGLGWQAKNTMLIHPRHGSYTLLGAILTTLRLSSSEELGQPEPTVPPTDHCANCTRCIEACPTDAIAAEGYRLNATKCISYLTLEHRSPIDSTLHAKMQDRLAGCDICQEVCPYNKIGERNPLPIALGYQPRLPAAVGVESILDWTEDDRQRVLQGSALKRIKLAMFKRNALIVWTNALLKEGQTRTKAELRMAAQRMQGLANDPETDAMVRETAKQCLARLTPNS